MLKLLRKFLCSLMAHGKRDDYDLAERDGTLTGQRCTRCGAVWHSLY